MSLKIEDVKVGDELVCIDRDGFNNSHRHNNTLTEFKVCKVGDLGVCINDGDWIIEIEELKYFKKKEQSQYTFNDLIDVVTRAYKDKLLSMYSVGGDGAVVLKYWIDSNPTRVLRETIIDNVIKHIQSLYKETFVIEDYEDIKRIKKDAQITLANNLKVKVFAAPLRHSEGWKVSCADGKQSGVLDIFALKGATVEQERGRDD